MLHFICKYLICGTYQREVQPFIKDGVGRLPLLLRVAAVTHLLVQRWPLQRRMLGWAQVFSWGGTLLVSCTRSWIRNNCLLASGAGLFAGFVEMHLLFFEVVVVVV